MPIWTPAVIGPELWLDASDAATLTLDGSAVTQWADKSGNGRHATPPLSAKPTYSTGRVTFGASGTSPLLTPVFDNPSGADGVMFAIAYQRTAANALFSSPLCKGALNTQWLMLLAEPGQSNISYLRNNLDAGNTAGSGNNAVTNNLVVYCGILSNAEIAQFLSGTELSGSQGAQSRSFGTSSALTIGSTPSGTYSDQRFEGHIHEIVLLHGDTSDDTRQKLEGYLHHRLALTANLPSDHPFKTNAPQLDELFFTGTVRDKTGSLASRHVTVIRESTHAIVSTTMSDPTTGAFAAVTYYNEPHTLIFSGESDRNALVYSGVYPE